MEHRIKRPEDLGELLGQETERDDFETYLKKKEAEAWTNPSDLAELDPVESLSERDLRTGKMVAKGKPEAEPNQSQLLEKFPGLTIPIPNVPGVGEQLPLETKSPTDETGEPQSSRSAQDADEKHTEIKIHSHPIAGTYITEEVKSFEMDPEFESVFIEAHKESVTNLTPEQTIERIHKIDRVVRLLRAQQGGLRVGLEEHLANATAGNRTRLNELSRQERLKNASKRVRKSASAPAKATSAPGLTSKLKKGIDTMVNNELSKENIENRLRTLKLLDEATQAYVNKCFA